MLRFRSSALCLLLATASLGGCMPQEAKAPATANAGVASAFARAMLQEASNPEDPKPYLDALDLAVKNPQDPDSLAVTVASLDVLTGMTGAAPYRVAIPLADRSREGFQLIVHRLRVAWESLEGSEAEISPLLRANIARSLHELAMFTGEEKGAKVWWSRRGCVPTATVVGPLDSAPLTALEGKGVIDAKAPFPAGFEADTAFGQVNSVQIDSDACNLEPRRTGNKLGLRELIVDVQNPEAQRLSFALTSSAAAVLEVGGVRVLERRYEAGGGDTTTFGHAIVGKGTLRIIVRLADKGDASGVELQVLDSRGARLASNAPNAGATATASVKQPVELTFARPSNGDAALIASAAALLATGDARRAEQTLERALLEKREGRDPALHLLWIRAMEMAGDMPDAKRIERTQAALNELEKSLPDSWESRLTKGDLAQRKKGYGEGTFTALESLGVGHLGADLSQANTMELAYIFGLAQQTSMQDLAERTYAALGAKAAGSNLAADLEGRLHRRIGADAVRVACDGGLARNTTGCAQAKRSVGDRVGALRELERLRSLRMAPSGNLSMELNLQMEQGDDKGALATYEQLLFGERSLMAILPALARLPDRAAATAKIENEALLVSDGPFALARYRALFSEPSPDAKKFEDAGRDLVTKDRQNPAMPGAATAVLKHVEHYGIDVDGKTRVVLYDLRRVSGTADVERGIFVEQPQIDGQGFFQQLRRRVHKKDGRILEPERASMASQGGSDLSQLEQGDYVEHYFEGVFVPGDTGELGIDTPDLLPERTSVREAELVIRMPSGFAPTMWIHPMLGKPQKTSKDGYDFLSFTLKNQAPRRIEDGLPYLERGVRVSLGTLTWTKVGRAIGENIRSLKETDPFVARFAKEAVAGLAPTEGNPGPTPEQTVAKVVEHVGKVIKVASGGSELSDFAGYYGGGSQGQTARNAIEEGVGSRTWIIFRTLQELGVPAEVAVAETEPFSAAANFPPHPGRFRKPLVVAKLPQKDIWIDADVQGPPLPPGRVSPELRGRSAILGNGDIVPVPIAVDDPVDEAKIELVLDASGTAKGKVLLTLRGSQAQGLAEAFFYVVGDDRTQMLRSVVQSFLPWASVDNVKLASKEGSWEIVLDAQVTIPGFGSPDTRDGKSWVLPGIEPAKNATLAQRYASRIERQSALNIDAPLQYRITRRITLPPGVSIDRPAKNLDKSRKELKAKRTVSVEGSTLVEHFELSLPTGTIDQQAYRGFLDDLQAVDAGFLAATRIKKQ